MPTQVNKDILTWITGAQSEAELEFIHKASKRNRDGGKLHVVGSTMKHVTSGSDVVWGTGALGVKGACSARGDLAARSQRQ